MSLLLTKTCEYAILVSIQQGRYFSTRNAYKIETELDLKLPPSIDDLIPTKTTLSSPIQKVDAHGHLFFNVSLVYFVSFKQLQRLRRNEATTTLTVKHCNNATQQQVEEEKDKKLVFFISEAKEVIPQSQHKLDHIYKFVSDKGTWCNIENSRQQLKVGLFYVAMPDNNSMYPGGSIMMNNTTPSIHLRSPPPTPIMISPPISTTTTTKTRITSTAAATANLNSSRKNKKIASILGTTNKMETSSLNGSSLNQSITSSSRKKKHSINQEQQQTRSLQRTKSSLVDLNIEELADVLAKINIFSDVNKTITAPKKEIIEQQSYHQIGKGSCQYTFYFKIVHADHIQQHTLLRQPSSTTIATIQKKYLKKPFFSYSFLTNYNLVPASSINNQKRTQEKSCFQLRGHLIDIQTWLDCTCQLQLNYIIMDKYKKETVGKCLVPLKGIGFQKKGVSDKVYPVYHLENDETMIAQVTVRMGLVSGWHQEDEEEEEEKQQQEEGKRLPPPLEQEIGDSWDWVVLNSKKQRHLSTSSVPTLLTSSTTSSTKSSTVAANHHKETAVPPPLPPPSLPSIHYVNNSHQPSSSSSSSQQHQKRPTAFSSKKSSFRYSTSSRVSSTAALAAAYASLPTSSTTSRNVL